MVNESDHPKFYAQTFICILKKHTCQKKYMLKGNTCHIENFYTVRFKKTVSFKHTITALMAV